MSQKETTFQVTYERTEKCIVAHVYSLSDAQSATYDYFKEHLFTVTMDLETPQAILDAFKDRLQGESNQIDEQSNDPKFYYRAKINIGDVLQYRDELGQMWKDSMVICNTADKDKAYIYFKSFSNKDCFNYQKREYRIYRQDVGIILIVQYE